MWRVLQTIISQRPYSGTTEAHGKNIGSPRATGQSAWVVLADGACGGPSGAGLTRSCFCARPTVKRT